MTETGAGQELVPWFLTMISKVTCWPLTSGFVVPLVGDLLMARSHVPELARSNRAVQLLAAVIVTEVLGVTPLQAPLQPANTEPGLGCAVSMTTVLAG